MLLSVYYKRIIKKQRLEIVKIFLKTVKISGQSNALTHNYQKQGPLTKS